MDDLNIVLRAILEASITESASRITAQLPAIQKLITDAITVPIGIDVKATQANISSAISSAVSKSKKTIASATDNLYSLGLNDSKAISQSLAVQDKIAATVKKRNDDYRRSELAQAKASNKALDDIYAQKQKNLSSSMDPSILSTNIDRAKAEIDTLKQKYSAFLSDPKLQDKYATLFSEGQLTETQQQYQHLTAGIREFRAEAEKAGKAQRSFADESVNNAKKMASWMLMGAAVSSAFRFVKDVVTKVKDLNSSFVDLQMATGGTDEAITSLMSSYNAMAKELGATTVEVSNSANSWLRQGKSISDTNTLIKDSMVLSKVAGIESAQSTEYLTTAMKGFKISTQDAMGIVDKLSAVDMASATSAAGLAEGMQQVATNADLAGISINKLLGYLAVIGETTGSSMSSVGQSLSTIFSRMGGIKLSRLTDTETGEDLSNVETVLREYGITLRDSNSEFRNFGTVLDEVANKWESYSSVAQRSIASAFAGKNHMEEFLVLMQNYGKAMEYAGVATDSAGTAMSKFSSYQNSIDAKQKTMQANMEAFSSAMLDSELVKGTYDAGSGFLGFLTQVTEKLGALPTLATTVAAALSFKNVGISNVKHAPSYQIGMAA